MFETRVLKTPEKQYKTITNAEYEALLKERRISGNTILPAGVRHKGCTKRLDKISPLFLRTILKKRNMGVNEAARWIGVSASTMRKWTRDGGEWIPPALFQALEAACNVRDSGKSLSLFEKDRLSLKAYQYRNILAVDCSTGA